MRTLMLVAFVLLSNLLSAQKIREWLRQKKTQKQYLIEQIAQYRIYLELAQKGYKIAKDGLTTIHDIKNGEFRLHKNYMDSLRIVSSQVSSYKRIGLIGSLHSQIQALVASSKNALSQSQYLSSVELAYVKGVYESLLEDCQQIRDALKDVTRDGPLSMSDDQRFKRIDLLCGQMQSNYSFVKAFSGEALVLAASRFSETDDIITRRVMTDAW